MSLAAGPPALRPLGRGGASTARPGWSCVGAGERTRRRGPVVRARAAWSAQSRAAAER
jgi:hypothetical protein